MFVTTAMMGASLRNEPSLSSDSTTRKSLLPTRALEPPMVATRAADDDGGVQAGVGQHGGGHGGGGGFAVAAGDGDAELQAHQLGEQFAAGNDGDCRRRASTTSGLARRRRELTTSAFAPARFGRRVPFVDRGAQRGAGGR